MNKLGDVFMFLVVVEEMILAIWPRLALNSWTQGILLLPYPKKLGLKVHTTVPSFAFIFEIISGYLETTILLRKWPNQTPGLLLLH